MQENNCGCGGHHNVCPPKNTQFNQCELEALNALGYIHNSTLDALSDIPNFLDLTREQRYNFIVPFVEAKIRNMGNIPFQQPSFKVEDGIITEIVGKENKIIASMFSQGKINSAQAEAFNYILNSTKSIQNAANLAIALNTFEAFILARTDMTAMEKAPIIAASVVAKASSLYWNQAFADPANHWYTRIHENFSDTTLFKIKWWDLLGAAVNCIGCGVAGGPAGCVGCAGISAPLASSIAGEK